MAVRNLRLEDDPILRKLSRRVSSFDDRLVELSQDMIDTMRVANGIGLAAPQVGILKRMIVIDASVLDGEPLTLINPEIIEEEGEQIEIEGCLSVPGFSGRVRRPKRVKVSYQDIAGVSCIMEGEDLIARVLCHEIDHLNGILYTDRVTGELVCNDCGLPESDCDCDEIHEEGCGCGCEHE